MPEVIEKLNEGDVYRWNYTDPGTDNRSYGSYHCCSCIAFVKNGRLYDTYWAHGFKSVGDVGRSFGIDDLPRLELKFLANVADLDATQSYQAEYYDDADIVDLTHANGGSFHLRKGAVRSQAKMLASARAKLEKSLSDEKMAAWRSERLRESIAKIEAGDIHALI